MVAGCSPFNRLYLGNRYCFLFLWVLRCFNSPGLPRIVMYSLYDTNSSCQWVPPFGHLRISAYLLLPVAFRCSSRPSSPISAKASSVRSFFLNLTNLVHYFFVFQNPKNHFFVFYQSSFLSNKKICDKYYPIFKDLYYKNEI